jgi:hypothetical protein
MKSKDNKKKFIISASRREDMTAFSPDRLERIIKGEAKGPLKHVMPEKIHTLVLWTRDFRNALKGTLFKSLNELKERYSCQIMMHLTVTGMAGTALEPGVPGFDRLIPELPALLRLLGKPERLFWRYDPLVTAVRSSNASRYDNDSALKITNIDENNFKKLADIFSDHGVKKCITSIVTPYEKVLKRLKKENIMLIPEHEKEKNFICFMNDFLVSKKMHLQTCCTHIDFNDQQDSEIFFSKFRGACISRFEIETLHDKGLVLDSDNSRPMQREDCLCDKSWDVGWYRKCPHHCLYCYARP